MKHGVFLRLCFAAACVLSPGLVGFGLFPANAEESFGPEAVREFTVKRENVFEFAKKPAVKRSGDRVEIEFETKSLCDVTVAVEDANGKIRRHLASGILGKNAPEPFQKSSRIQKIIWDGKDDFGEYLDDKDALTIRVSLGLKAMFEKNLYWHPNRRLHDQTSVALAFDEEGVYLYQNNMTDHILKFDHKGKYLQTIYPFPANKLKEVKGLKWRKVPGQENPIPDKGVGSGEMQWTVTLLPLQPYLYKTDGPLVGDMFAYKGILYLNGDRLIRVGTDGTTRGMELSSPCPLVPMLKNDKSALLCPATVTALSPDGTWMYMTRVLGSPADRCWAGVSLNKVFRMPADGSAVPKPFAGLDNLGLRTLGVGKMQEAEIKEIVAKDSANPDNLQFPMGVAIDSKNRVYIADNEHDRVQVYSPEGKFLRTIEALCPADIQLDPKTDEIYIACWNGPPAGWIPNCDWTAYLKRLPPVLRKFAPLDSVPGGNPKLLMEASLSIRNPLNTNEIIADPSRSPRARVKIDFFSNPKRIYLQFPVESYVQGRAGIWIMEEQANALKFVGSLYDEAAKAGYRDYVGGFQKQYLAFDPVREVLCVGETGTGENKIIDSFIEIDVNSGKFRYFNLPAGAAEAGFDAKGFLYLRVGPGIVRFDPKTMKEVPYDYGDNRPLQSALTSVGITPVSAVGTPGAGGSRCKYNAFSVSPRGETIEGCVWAALDDPKDRRNAADKALSYSTKTWSPALYPGRPWSDNFIHIYDQYGNLLKEDALSGCGVLNGGVDMDFQGNLYANIRAGRMLDGAPYGRNGAGTVVKFKGTESRLLTSDNPIVKLTDQIPGKPVAAGRWAPGALWAIGEASMGSGNHCWCRNGRFKVDYFGRVFVPQSDRYSVAVLDTNGQMILGIGRYGNADSAGPKSLVPLGGDEVGLMDANYVTVHTDRRVFISDMGNGRIISVKLDYAANETINLKEVPDAANAE